MNAASESGRQMGEEAKVTGGKWTELGPMTALLTPKALHTNAQGRASAPWVMRRRALPVFLSMSETLKGFHRAHTRCRNHSARFICIWSSRRRAGYLFFKTLNFGKNYIATSAVFAAIKSHHRYRSVE